MQEGIDCDYIPIFLFCKSARVICRFKKMGGVLLLTKRTILKSVAEWDFFFLEVGS